MLDVIIYIIYITVKRLHSRTTLGANKTHNTVLWVFVAPMIVRLSNAYRLELRVTGSKVLVIVGMTSGIPLGVSDALGAL